MWSFVPSVLVLLAFVQLASADASPFGGPVWQEAHVEFVDPPQGWTFFVVCNSFVRQVPVTSDGVSLTQLTAGSEYFRSRIGVTLFAVPNDVLTEAGSDVPGYGWFTKNSERIRRATIGPGGTFEGARRYRVKLSETVWEVEQVSSGGSSWVSIAAVLLSSVLVVFGVHLFRRLRRKSVTRTTPPSGN